jgi:hypothetical protein
MKITEIRLSKGAQRLEFRGRQIGTLERLHSRTTGDILHISLESGADLNLQSAVDVSQQLRCPRIFVIEGNPLDSFVVFGGERMYRVIVDGRILCETSLYRRFDDTEYWTTKIIEDRRGIIIVYEGGVLAVDEDLKVRWHRKKFFNDVFVAAEDNVLKFVRDHDAPWSMRADDGTDIS